jgi:hypothetical protein
MLLFGQCGDLLAIVQVCWRDGERQQVPQRVDRDMDLRSLASLGSVIARPRPRLRRGLQTSGCRGTAVG